MNTSNIIRFTIIGGLWLWLAVTILVRGGFYLINLFWIVASGILVFVPLWKKYVTGSASRNSNSDSATPKTKRKK